MKGIKLFEETVTIGKGVKDVVIVVHEAFTVTVDLSVRASNDAREDRAKDGFRSEIDDEAFMVADASMLLQDGGVDHRGTRSSKYGINRERTRNKGGWKLLSRDLLTLFCHEKVVLSKALGKATSVDMLVEVAAEDDLFIAVDPGEKLVC